ncbi:cell traversal protein for ookinetes and sporozoites [Plasmodium chabaudi chabaudi]|uniref:Cell traversal protein for ookinetes and sporozoites n=2 Tax=Plasmodium chabaudi TaxID=5825 RepID=A0A077TR60_PLACU|nr:cell traversal protein for ookinetes and sporozoites [Plasmodium chabaudi chabaudi]SCM25103.1 cell traversal protein for ookinetes and sporozoites [Plasmodium chabaudi adami]SCM26388.1 cell traversal protein for ookinetes and sporozoites [Plasmodium chabaudi chabaudi]VTZ71021.1 cell traversal protein for ookinetes and sporozoites [Plasmodium chabaudi chabaudi]|eukprot:XP_743594.1 cell traversal protein for ookinetes and sporozoites [Plasmodium chabaudi chabaudi]
MNKLTKLSVISSVLVFFCFFNVLCLRGKNGSEMSSSLEGGVESAIRIKNSLESFISESASLDDIGNGLAETITNEIFSAVQQDSSSFLQTQFDIKKHIKENAKKVLIEAIRLGLEPVEKIVAKSIQPPKINRHTYSLVSPVVKSLFNKIEEAVHKPVSDSIWEYEGGEEYDESEEDNYEDELFN